MTQEEEIQKFITKVAINEGVLLLLLALGFYRKLYSIEVFIGIFIGISTVTALLIFKKIQEIKNRKIM